MTPPTPRSLFFGLSFDWSYALVSFVLLITGCLPLALLLTMHVSTLGNTPAKALMIWLPLMALVIALICGLFYPRLRQQVDLQRPVLLGMWCLSVLGMVGWWTI